MNKFITILILTIATGLMCLSCGGETNPMSAIKNGEELEEGASVPFLLYQNYPNPFNPSTVIRYQVAEPMHLRMRVFTEDWQEVNTLFDQVKVAGYHNIQFKGLNTENESLPSGEYFYTLEGNGLTLVRKMKIIK